MVGSPAGPGKEKVLTEQGTAAVGDVVVCGHMQLGWVHDHMQMVFPRSVPSSGFFGC